MSQPSSPETGEHVAPSLTDFKAITEQWAEAKRNKESQEAAKATVAARLGPLDDQEKMVELDKQQEKLDLLRRRAYDKRWYWTVAFWAWLLVVHAVGLSLFTGGFLLTRLVLPDMSACSTPPIDSPLAPLDAEKGCWHPKVFDRAVVIIVDALRYDFTVPHNTARAHHYHNAFPFLYDTALKWPRHAFLRPFIADPPTTTLQRLKGLTTGTLPTFVDAGSNFAGTAIDEDNLLMQLKLSGKKIAHLGDDTWVSLFPGYFEPNISKAYDSFNVWDLHTVDNGVMDNILPLLSLDADKWDLLIGHCLGVDHAGHHYGPDHPAMNAKLRQMDEFVAQLASAIDEDTLLVVMGDHGMDAKGDHGGESDDEVQAALWMYSRRPVFGRISPDHVTPPPTAKVRPLNQIDLVPTLALLLGIPIPYNNLGRPIEEVFSGPSGNDWANLAAVSRLSAAGIERYQKSYFDARSIVPASGPNSTAALWAQAKVPGLDPQQAHEAFVRYQDETLRLCRSLWARFDVPRMIGGVLLSAAGLVLLAMYSSRGPDDHFLVLNDAELDYADKKLELMSFGGELDPHPDQSYHSDMLRSLIDARLLFVAAATLLGGAAYLRQALDGIAALIMVPTMVSVGISLRRAGRTISNLLPRTFWGWLSLVFTLSHSIGFASNSYTIWEDSILLFFIAAFGLATAVASFRIASPVDRAMAIYHSLAFVALGRLASYSKLCREEQMPYCSSTYYASVSSSSSAPWQLVIPFLVFIGLPSVVRSYLEPTRSYQGLAPTWIGYAFRSVLLVSACHWVVDAAAKGDWLVGRFSETIVKMTGVYLAQLGLAMALVAGTTAFIWAPPCVSILSRASRTGQTQVAILGYANALGARYLMLPLNLLGACILLSKPMGTGALGLMLWQVLSLVEIIDLVDLKDEPVGPIMLAIVGNFYFFKTGHQAVLSSIQWDSAFIPLLSVRYPWSPLVIALNTFAGPIIAAACLPLVVVWKTGPKQKGVLETVSRAAAIFIAYYAVEALATMSWAGWLRRHLMLYRVFSPRFMMAAVLLLVLDLVILLVTLTGLRSTTLSVSEVFGWAD